MIIINRTSNRRLLIPTTAKVKTINTKWKNILHFQHKTFSYSLANIVYIGDRLSTNSLHISIAEISYKSLTEMDRQSCLNKISVVALEKRQFTQDNQIIFSQAIKTNFLILVSIHIHQNVFFYFKFFSVKTNYVSCFYIISSINS